MHGDVATICVLHQHLDKDNVMTPYVMITILCTIRAHAFEQLDVQTSLEHCWTSAPVKHLHLATSLVLYAVHVGLATLLPAIVIIGQRLAAMLTVQWCEQLTSPQCSKLQGREEYPIG